MTAPPPDAPRSAAERAELALDNLTPRQIVAELDKYVVGQRAAKRSVAIALRNRWRRQQLPREVADDIVPKNILMIGPTGVGKTEIARRLAKLARAPFLKVEASKFTEVGYVGRDCESIVRDLTEIGVAIVREERREAVAATAAERAEERLLDLLLPPGPPPGAAVLGTLGTPPMPAAGGATAAEAPSTGSGPGGRPLDAREAAREAALGRPRRAHRRDRGRGRRRPLARDVHAAGRRRDRPQSQGDDARPVLPPAAAEGHGRRGARGACSRRRPRS